MSDRLPWAATFDHSLDEEVVAADIYLESLLAAHSAGQRRAALHARVEGLPPGLRAAADVLERALPRFHPSYRFEEALAQRLQAASRLSRAEGPGLLDFPEPALAGLPTGGDARRGLLVGGAIASGVSLAGVAIFAWRRSRRPH